MQPDIQMPADPGYAPESLTWKTCLSPTGTMLAAWPVPCPFRQPTAEPPDDHLTWDKPVALYFLDTCVGRILCKHLLAKTLQGPASLEHRPADQASSEVAWSPDSRTFACWAHMADQRQAAIMLIDPKSEGAAIRCWNWHRYGRVQEPVISHFSPFPQARLRCPKEGKGTRTVQ